MILFLLSGTSWFSAPSQPGLPEQIITWIMNDVCSSGCSDENRATYRSNLRFELHDLNGDKNPEFFVYVNHPDWCGNHFNCGYYVFQRSPAGYRLLVSGYPALRITNSSTGGYRDLESRHNIGACRLAKDVLGQDVFVSVLKFDGKEYKEIKLGNRCVSPKARPASRIVGR